MPTKRCRDCGDDFESEEGVGSRCAHCYIESRERKEGPLPVDIMMERHRRYWRWPNED
jgi:endonuclease III